MEAKITITMTPSEFDLVRESISEAVDAHYHIRRDTKDAAVRRAAVEREAQLRELLVKLGK